MADSTTRQMSYALFGQPYFVAFPQNASNSRIRNHCQQTIDHCVPVAMSSDIRNSASDAAGGDKSAL